MKTKKPALVTCRKHWSASVVPGLFFGLLFLGGIAGLVTDGAEGFIAIAAAVVLFGICYLLIHANYLALREDAVVGKTGFIKTVKVVAPISKIQDVSVHSGLFGKLFGYSTVTVSTAGTAGTEYIFTKVANAEEFQQKYIEIANR